MTDNDDNFPIDPNAAEFERDWTGEPAPTPPLHNADQSSSR